jgi:hypothetical protein
MTGILQKYFKNPDQVLADIYANGGTRLAGYGFISGGYGGGVDIDQFHRLVWIDGYLAGMGDMNRRESHTVAKAINDALIARYPDVNADNCPFINLTEAA